MRAAFLIHGFMTNKDDFARLIPLIKPRYDFVYCPDLPYHGPDELKTQMNAEVVLDFVVHEFDILSQTYGAVDVFGFSMGGALAVYLTKIRNVNRLVLLAPANKYLSAGYLFSAAKYYLDGAANRKAKPHKGDVCISCFEQVRQDNQAALKMFAKQLFPRYTIKNLTEFSKVVRLCNKDLKEIRPPTLIIWGRLDQLVPQFSVNFLFKLCTNPIKSKIICADLSHYMLRSQSFYRITDYILWFLEESEPRLEYNRLTT